MAINIIACTYKQIPRIIRLIFPKKKEVDETIFRSSQIRKTFLSSKNISYLERQSEALIQSLAGNPVKITKDGSRYFFAEKGKFSRTGMLMVHISILLILAGGLAGTIGGFTGHMNIIEGEKSDTATLFGEKKARKLGFAVRCDDFSVDFYETGMPREYKTDLTIIDNGKEVVSGVIRVNHPFVYKGDKIMSGDIRDRRWWRVPDRSNE